MAEAPSKGAPVAKRLRKLTDKVLDGLTIEDMRCVSCSGYGNCGYKSMFLKDEGGLHRFACVAARWLSANVMASSIPMSY